MISLPLRDCLGERGLGGDVLVVGRGADALLAGGAAGGDALGRLEDPPPSAVTTRCGGSHSLCDAPSLDLSARLEDRRLRLRADRPARVHVVPHRQRADAALEYLVQRRGAGGGPSVARTHAFVLVTPRRTPPPFIVGSGAIAPLVACTHTTTHLFVTLARTYHKNCDVCDADAPHTINGDVCDAGAHVQPNVVCVTPAHMCV